MAGDLKAEAIERMADALAETVDMDVPWSRYAEAALTALLTVLYEQGWKIVPKAATEHQYEAMKVFVECCLSSVGKIDVGLTYATGVAASPSPFPEETKDGE